MVLATIIPGSLINLSPSRPDRIFRNRIFKINSCLRRQRRLLLYFRDRANACEYAIYDRACHGQSSPFRRARPRHTRGITGQGDPLVLGRVSELHLIGHLILLFDKADAGCQSAGTGTFFLYLRAARTAGRHSHTSARRVVCVIQRPCGLISVDPVFEERECGASAS